MYQLPGAAGYVTTGKVADVANACRKLLIEKGWQPYGGYSYDQKFSAGQEMEFKKKK